jgi:citrate lyase beta subunit
MTNRPRRSLLYMPGSSPRALDKARSLPADGLILDLEDAVAPAEKSAARENVCENIRKGGYGGRELIVRINGLDTEWGEDDLAAAAAAGPHAIAIPKVSSPAMIEEVEALMVRAGASESTAIWAMMETPRGVLHAEAIAASTPRLQGFIMGTNDLVADLGAAHTRDRAPVMTALGLCILAARAYGIAIVDGVYNAFKDEDGLRASCEQGRALGFDGKTLIHPAQLAIANAVFGPAIEDIELAMRQVAAFDSAKAEGKGVAVVDGKIVENLHVAAAKRLLEKAAAIKALEAESGQ